MREIALPAPGSDEQLAEQVARIVARPLDRARPLWEVYVIHGLGHGRVALLTKIHHSVIDGLSGAEIMGAAARPRRPRGARLPAAEDADAPTPTPGELEMLARGLLGLPRYPLRLLRALPHGAPEPRRDAPFSTLPGRGHRRPRSDASRALRRGDGVLERADLKAPKTLVQRPHLAAPALRLRTAAARHRQDGQEPYGCTVNDVVVSICAGAVRRWLVEHDELPDEPLVAQIPVSVRSDDEMGTFGNRIMLMSAPLYTDIEDPVERLRATHEALREMKERHRALPAELLQDANHFIPPAVFSRAAR